jgi:ABC-type nitrate/sulfonate/bicarbonate transport system ATPase subunit
MKLRNVDVAFGSRVIYRDFSIEFADGSITAVLGPSGCGKTTLLNYIARAHRDGRTSYVFQEPRLLPWRTVERNITLVLSGSAEERRYRARHYLERVGLLGRSGDFPANLSGGERQRVAIARAFSYPAPILLMDEPFQSQDPGQKNQLIELVKILQADEKRTIIAVTHDVREAVALADRAIVLAGRPVRIAFDAPISSGMENALTEVLTCQASLNFSPS